MFEACEPHGNVATTAGTRSKLHADHFPAHPGGDGDKWMARPASRGAEANGEVDDNL